MIQRKRPGQPGRFSFPDPRSACRLQCANPSLFKAVRKHLAKLESAAIDAQFALTEATLALAKLVAAFRVELLDRAPVTPVGVVTTQPDRSPMFRITPRDT